MQFVVVCPNEARPRGATGVDNLGKRYRSVETALILKREFVVSKVWANESTESDEAFWAAVNWSDKGDDKVGMVFLTVAEPIKLRFDNADHGVRIRQIGGGEVASLIELPPGEYAYEILVKKR